MLHEVPRWWEIRRSNVWAPALWLYGRSNYVCLPAHDTCTWVTRIVWDTRSAARKTVDTCRLCG